MNNYNIVILIDKNYRQDFTIYGYKIAITDPANSTSRRLWVQAKDDTEPTIWRCASCGEKIAVIVWIGEILGYETPAEVFYKAVSRKMVA